MEEEIEILETKIYSLEADLRVANEIIEQLREDKQSWHIGHGGEL